jgi:hypothetical protein
MMEQMRGEPVDFTELPDISMMLGPAMEAMRTQYPALASAPKIIQEALLFPYLKGYVFVSAVWQAEGGRPAPFGDHLPQSTEQVLRPSRAFGPDVDDPTELAIGPVDGFETVYRNTFGQGEFEVLLEEHLGPEGRVLAQGWDGDRYVLLEDQNGAQGLAWVSVWDSEAERDRFVEGFASAVSGLPAPATLESTEYLDRPGAILRVALPADLQLDVTEKTND